jgi:hypothetical protein
MLSSEYCVADDDVYESITQTNRTLYYDVSVSGIGARTGTEYIYTKGQSPPNGRTASDGCGSIRTHTVACLRSLRRTALE